MPEEEISFATATPTPPPRPLSKSAWVRGPPQSETIGLPMPSSRSQLPVYATSSSSLALTNAHAAHPRRPNALCQGVPIKDGVGVSRDSVGVVKPGVFPHDSKSMRFSDYYQAPL